ncbi:MAG: 4-alpha-glucanotransferase [Methanomicrobiales archaeon]|nr:4-alpha-glucanotransferase [Methanomicrobiales archaeon]
MKTRGSGILLHITSLPSPYGIGDVGPAAYTYLDFLYKTGQRYWQILPIHPTDIKYDDSPYHSLSAFAGNILLISPDLLIEEGLLDYSDLDPLPVFNSTTIDFNAVTLYKKRLLEIAFHRFRYFGSNNDFSIFCEEQAWWLDDYALFMAIRDHYPDSIWYDWPEELKNRDENYIREFKRIHSEEFERERFFQYVFFFQWTVFKKKCNEYGIWLIGDIPIYVDYDSSDVWSNPELFQLDELKKPVKIAGVPPDYFSSTGQVWNNPLYSWDTMRKDNFSWWIKRIKRELQCVDYLRIDHFRGLVGYFAIPAGAETAINGEWVEAPVWDFLRTLERNFSYLPIIAEDLGIITPDVREVMREFSIPGMKVLLFAFTSETSENPYILHNTTKNSLIYTGTHDNNTIIGWFTTAASELEKQRLFSYIGREINQSEICDVFIRMAMISNSNTAIIPMQDLLCLDDSARMNIPGTDNGNWKWIMQKEMITDELVYYLNNLLVTYGRK